VERARAPRPIVDVVASRRARASQAPTRVENFTDGHGHVITIGTSLDGVDLRPIAMVLAGTIHGEEIEDLRVRVVRADEVGALCGGGKGVVACYGPDDERRLPSGEMIVPYDAGETTHAVVHEYGHHLDNQLWNLSPLGLCGLSNDGSRRWFFARQVADNIIRDTGCSVETRWDRLLGEVFAEDFVVLNGIAEWVLDGIRPPSAAVLSALRKDIAHPFDPRTRRARGRVGLRRARTMPFRLGTYTFVTASVNGTPGADLDLFVFRRGARRPLERSTGRSSRERIRTLLAPGSYDLDVFAQRARGTYRVTLALE
jgi:hypothetical protein